MTKASDPNSPREQHAPETSAQDLSIMAASVDETLANGIHWLRFPDRLEARFERETGPSRARHFIIGGLVAIAIYDLFLLVDYTLIPDVFQMALIMRLGIMTPVACLIMIALHRGMPPILREGIEATITVCSSASLVYLASLSTAPGATRYYVGLTLVITFGNVVVQIRFWYALAASLATLGVYVVSPIFYTLPPATQINSLFILGSSIVFTLFANYSLERERRQNYLLGLRERIRRSELTASNAKLTQLSQIDPLTGMANRRAFDAYLLRLHHRSALDTLGIIMCDVDHFKRYNDQYGHLAGDECLCRVAEALSRSLRHQGDMLARVGGEEFTAVLPDSSLPTVRQVAERMRITVLELAIPHATSSTASVVTVSVGIAVAAIDIDIDIQGILAIADAALYRAKSAGRNCVHE